MSPFEHWDGLAGPIDRPLPHDDAPVIDWLRYRQCDVLSAPQAVQAFGRSALRNRLARSQWQRPARGIVVAHNGPLTDVQRLWIAILSSGPGALCAGATAATLEGLRGYRTRDTHILVPAGRRVSAARGVVVHRTTTLPDDHCRGHAAPPRTTIARSIVDAAAWARRDDDARAIVAAAFQQRRVTVDEIDAVLRAMPRSRRRALVRETMTAAAGGAEAISELELVNLCRRFGLPTPVQQTVRNDRAGRRRFLDAYWPDWRLHAEIDGAWHTEVRAWWDDMRRQNDVWITGDRILRFPVWALRHEPEAVAAQIRAALQAAGWRP